MQNYYLKSHIFNGCNQLTFTMVVGGDQLVAEFRRESLSTLSEGAKGSLITVDDAASEAMEKVGRDFYIAVFSLARRVFNGEPIDLPFCIEAV